MSKPMSAAKIVSCVEKDASTDFINSDGTAGRNTPAQLPLITVLDLVETVDLAPLNPSRTHSRIALLPHLNAVQALLQGPTPLAQLVTLEAATDGLTLIDTLRQFGLQLPVRRVPGFDSNYDIISCHVCALTGADVRRIHRVLKKAEVDHGFPTHHTGEGELGDHHIQTLRVDKLNSAEFGQGHF